MERAHAALGERGCEGDGIGHVIVRSTGRMIDEVATASRCAALERDELRRQARYVDQGKALAVHYRHETEVGLRFRLVGDQVRDPVLREPFARPKARVAIPHDLMHPVGFQQRGELCDHGFR